MMKSIKYLAAFSLLLLAVSCYQKQELDYSKWYPKDEVNTDKPNEEADTLMLMSSNVRFYSARNKAEDPDVGERDWEVRKTGYFQMLNTMQPQVMGVQEAEFKQVDDIVANCPGYSYVGVGRNDGERAGESTAIFYKKDLITVEDWGTKWSSSTPDVIGSYFPENEDKQCRTSTWAIFKVVATGRRFFHINVHTSLYSASQTKEVQLITEIVKEKCPVGVPVVLTGDWNLEETDPIMKPINDTYKSARQTAPLTDNSVTFHWWGSQSTISQNKHLDHIFYAGFEACPRFRTLNMKWNNLWISDHHPVYTILEF